MLAHHREMGRCERTLVAGACRGPGVERRLPGPLAGRWSCTQVEVDDFAADDDDVVAVHDTSPYAGVNTDTIADVEDDSVSGRRPLGGACGSDDADRVVVVVVAFVFVVV